MAHRFVRDGHHVIAAARRIDRLDSLRAELGSALLPMGLVHLYSHHCRIHAYGLGPREFICGKL